MPWLLLLNPCIKLTNKNSGVEGLSYKSSELKLWMTGMKTGDCIFQFKQKSILFRKSQLAVFLKA